MGEASEISWAPTLQPSTSGALSETELPLSHPLLQGGSANGGSR